jgi:hypothetical protein
VVLDEGWAENIGRGNNKLGWILDEYCRPIPNKNTFPGSNGTSFAYLAKYLRARGLSLGLWHMKGIPEAALNSGCKIKGSEGKLTARDVAVTSKRCVWHEDVYEADMSTRATQLYFRSIAELFRDWGVEYVKIDCVFGERDWDVNSMVGFSKALAEVFPPGHMVYSVSPGVNAKPERVDGVSEHLSSYRITDDLWDHWGPEGDQAPSGINVLSVTKALVNFAPKTGMKGFGGRQAYPDADMLPFGLIRLGGEHMSRILPAEARYIYGLWSISLSPMVLGGDMTSMKELPWMRELLTNQGLQGVSTKGTKPRVLDWKEPGPGRPGHSVWLNLHREEPTWRHLGIFPYNTRKGTTDVVRIRVAASKLELPADTKTVTFVDLVAGTPNTTVTMDTPDYTFEFPSRSNDGNVFLVIPSPACCQPNVLAHQSTPQPAAAGGEAAGGQQQQQQQQQQQRQQQQQQAAHDVVDPVHVASKAAAAGGSVGGDPATQIALNRPNRVFPNLGGGFDVEALKRQLEEQRRRDVDHAKEMQHDADRARAKLHANDPSASSVSTAVEVFVIILVVAAVGIAIRIRRSRRPAGGFAGRRR